MTNFLKKNWLIIIVFILAIVLRFWRLDSYPALNADEASNGYDAYSLIMTGMDQHGNSWPVHFQSFNDFKPGLYVYLALPFVKFLGLNEWAVRIPGAFLGAATVLIIYLLVLELFRNKKFALLSALFLAISPWHIHFSRGGWEVNTATFFITLGVLFFIKAAKNPKLISFAISIAAFSLSLYAYHAARVISPLLGVGLLVIYRKDIFKKQNIKNIFIAILLFVLLLIPLARDVVKGEVLPRAAGVGLFADPGPLNRINEQRGEHVNINDPLAKILHNKVVNYGLAFIRNWESHYTGEFLFMTGDVIQRNRVPETGEMYLTDILFLAIGILALVKAFAFGTEDQKRSWKIILLWLIVAPFASALTFQSPNALRAQNMSVTLVIISAYGLTKILEWGSKIRNKNLGISLIIIISLAMVWNFARYLHMYWVHMAKEYPFSSQYGVKELASYVSQNQSKYDDVFVTNRYDQPYILFLFYMKYPPQKFQFHHGLTTPDEFGFSTVTQFDKYHFGTIDFPSLRSNYPNSLIIGTPTEIPKESNIVKKIYGTNGYEYFDIVAN